MMRPNKRETNRVIPILAGRPARLGRTVALGVLCALAACFNPTLAQAGDDSDKEKSEVKWHKSFLGKARSSLGNIEEFADTQWRRFADDMGFAQPRHIAAYSGYGNRDKVWVRGRLLANKPYGGPRDDDNWWDNLQATYQRWESDEIPNAEIELTYGDTTRTVVTDGEGYYHAVFDRDRKYPQTDMVIAQHHLDDRRLSAIHKIYLPAEEAEFMVISDMDDTVIHTGITDLLTAAQLTFLRNAKTRKPLTGVGGLYSALAKGTQSQPVNPVFYVSNSAWNMYDLLRDFIALNDLPRGPLLLRDIGLNSDSGSHKPDTVSKLIERHPRLPAILVGDSGQHDADIYAQVAEKYPDRIKAIYIRDIDPGEDSEYDINVDAVIARSERLGIPFIRIEDSSEIAQHAVSIGLLPGSDLDDVARDVRADKKRETLAEETMVPDVIENQENPQQ